MNALAMIMQEPTTNRDAWHYTSLKAIEKIAFIAAAPIMLTPEAIPPLLDANHQTLVFSNGVYQPSLSQLAGLPADCFAGDEANGYTLTIPPQSCLATTPLELLCLSEATDQPQQSTLALTITLGENARLTLIERHATIRTITDTTAPSLTVITITAALAEQAKLVHIKLQQQATTAYHLATTNAQVSKGAYYDHFAFTGGAAWSRHSLTVSLTAPEAQTRLNGLYLLRNQQHSDTTSLINHAAPHTTSEEHYRGVLDDKAKGVFQGKIIVAPHAQKTDGRQMSRALLLSEQAEANHKPELEIYADDVQCSHGTTIGQLDAHALFYLRSRGIPASQARAMLIQGFITSVLDEISVAVARDYALAQAAHWSAGAL